MRLCNRQYVHLTDWPDDVCLHTRQLGVSTNDASGEEKKPYSTA